MSERNASTVWNVVVVVGSEKTSVIYHSLGPAPEELRRPGHDQRKIPVLNQVSLYKEPWPPFQAIQNASVWRGLEGGR